MQIPAPQQISWRDIIIGLAARKRKEAEALEALLTLEGVGGTQSEALLLLAIAMQNAR